MILDSDIQDVIALEQILVSAGYEVSSLTGPYGVLPKLDFVRPDILILNPDMDGMDTDALLLTLSQTPSMKDMLIILTCRGNPADVEAYCLNMGLHGYFMKDNGFEGILNYLDHFYDRANA